MRFLKYALISLVAMGATTIVSYFASRSEIGGYIATYFVFLVMGFYAIFAEMEAEYQNDVLRADYDDQIDELKKRIEALETGKN